MRSNNNLVCVLTKNGKARKVPRLRAEEIVEAGGKFISRTRFKALTSGIKVPEKLFKQGDRAVKDYIEEKLKQSRRQSQKSEGDDTQDAPKKKGKKRRKAKQG